MRVDIKGGKEVIKLDKSERATISKAISLTSAISRHCGEDLRGASEQAYEGLRRLARVLVFVPLSEAVGDDEDGAGDGDGETAAAAATDESEG